MNKFFLFFNNSDLSIYYLNGLIILALHLRFKTPKLQLFNIKFDHKIYVKKLDAFFYKQY